MLSTFNIKKKGQRILLSNEGNMNGGSGCRINKTKVRKLDKTMLAIL
jgi:hypothetical protein